MSIAIISDIHANLEALTAVLKDIERARKRYDIDEIYCLGDIVNYGPDPKECVDLVRKHCSVVLRGNHDEAVGTGNEVLLKTFNDLPEKGARWTRGQLSEGDRSYLAGLPHQHLNNGLAAVHGTLCSKLWSGDHDYANGDAKKNLEFASFTLYCDSHRPGDQINIGRCFQSLQDVGSKVCVVGHVQIAECYRKRVGGNTVSLIPMTAKRKGLVSVTLPIEMMYRYIFDVGAVGQPRDDDARASYGIYHKDKFVIRRVPYDFKATQKKIIATKALASAFAYRLEHGR